MTTTLITGISSGIELGLAKQFAAGVDNVVVTASREDKLNGLDNELQKSHNVIVTVILSDLSKLDEVDRIFNRLHDRAIKIDTVANSADFEALGNFAELCADRQTDMLMVNVVALTRLTRKLLPAMLGRGTGGILNVGSIAAHQAGPNMAVYYASKAYVLSFTEALREELVGTGLHVTCLEPGATESGFGEDSGMGKLDIFSQAMSAAAVAKVGYEGFRKNEDVVIPGWKNRLMVTFVGFLPRFANRKIVGEMQGI